MYNDKGEEVLDTTPVNIPVRFKIPIPLNERIKQMVRQEASQLAQQNGQETFEEADDFDIPDDNPDPTTPWEEDFDPQVPFVGSRESEIRAGVVPDIDESKIHAGKKEIQRIRREKASASKPLPEVKSEPSGEPSLPEDDVLESTNDNVK